jgi:hypothetical protein
MFSVSEDQDDQEIIIKEQEDCSIVRYGLNFVQFLQSIQSTQECFARFLLST